MVDADSSVVRVTPDGGGKPLDETCRPLVPSPRAGNGPRFTGLSVPWYWLAMTLAYARPGKQRETPVANNTLATPQRNIS